MASLRPEKTGKPSSSMITRSAVANARCREPLVAVTVPKPRRRSRDSRRRQVANDDDFAEGDEHRVRHYRRPHP